MAGPDPGESAEWLPRARDLFEGMHGIVIWKKARGNILYFSMYAPTLCMCQFPAKLCMDGIPCMPIHLHALRGTLASERPGPGTAVSIYCMYKILPYDLPLRST